MRRSWILRLSIAGVCSFFIVFFYIAPYISRVKKLKVGTSPRPGSSTLFLRRKPILDEKIVHIDLKGMPPDVSYYKQLFPFLKQHGVNQVLIEYEDMFPYEGILKPIRNLRSYSKDDILTILYQAKINNIKVIPLVQTFGHLEFLLKVHEFIPAREIELYPQAICPSRNISRRIIEHLITQVVDLHPDLEYLHIGCDEVYHMGMCGNCQERMTHFEWTKSDLFVDHVKWVSNFVINTFGNIRPMMWDDEFRKLDEDAIKQSGLGNLVDIVVWNYSPDVEIKLTYDLWDKYSRVFKSVWIGSAFKGANKVNSIFVNETLYLQNHHAWMQLVERYSDSIKFKGIIFTGWQRYDHFSVLCELFPVAIPSLVSCITYVNATYDLPFSQVFETAIRSLKCLTSGSFYGCSFPGNELHDAMQEFKSVKDKYEQLEKTSVFAGWADEFNLNQAFSNPSYSEVVYDEVVSINSVLVRLESHMFAYMSRIFPDWSINEWKETYWYPFQRHILYVKNRVSRILSKTSFPVRPLQIS